MSSSAKSFSSLCRVFRSSQIYDTFTGTQEQHSFSCVASTPFFYSIPLSVVRESGGYGFQGLANSISHISQQSGDWWMRKGGRGLEVNYRQQRGHRAYYFGVRTCNGPMGMTFTMTTWPRPSIPSTPQPNPHTPSLTFILKEMTAGPSGMIMKRPTGRMMNRTSGCSLAASGALKVALDS